MIKTLRESKAKLSELVRLASEGQDVLITVRGEVKARLTRASSPQAERNQSQWIQELRVLQRSHGTGRSKLSIDSILTDSRSERID